MRRIVTTFLVVPPSCRDLDAAFEKLQSGVRSDDPILLRLYRALSWLKLARTEDKTSDPFRNHTKCISLWIAFNAAYAADDDRGREHQRYEKYLTRILRRDSRRLYCALSNNLESHIVDLTDNEFVLPEFWDDPNSQKMWNGFEEDRASIKSAMKYGKHIDRIIDSELQKPADVVLKKVFRRLYELRNQLMHGCATAGGFVNRRQVETGAHILDILVPIFLDIMMTRPLQYWGRVPYPLSPEIKSARSRRRATVGS